MSFAPPETIPTVDKTGDKNGDRDAEALHHRALDASIRYRRAEAELIEILQEAEARGIFMRRGHASLYQYVVSELGLSESVAYNLIIVARKVREVPALGEMLRAQAITLSNARRVAAVLTRENQREWLAKAANLSHRKLEREIATVRPQAATPERATYTSGEYIRLEVGLREREMLRLRRAQDLLCRSKRRPVTLAETIEALAKDFLRRNDPLEKAKRFQVRQGGATETVGEAIKAEKSDEGDEEKEQIREEEEEEEVKRNETAQSRSERAQSEPAQGQSEVKAPDHLIDELGKLATLQVPVACIPTTNDAPEVKQGNTREAIPAATRHRISLRDGGRCTYRLRNGMRCNQTRWIEIHHRLPVHRGGPNAVENLTTLCSVHHRKTHRMD